MLSFSKNFPASLHARASAMHDKALKAENDAKVGLILRLTWDSRMDNIWSRFTKRVRSNHKPTSVYYRPARVPKNAAALSLEDAQAKALEELFCVIVSSVEGHSLLSFTDPLNGVADRVLQDVGRLGGDNSRRSRGKAKKLLKAAAVYSSQGKRDPARDVALELATYFRERFGEQPFKTIATITGVAFERNIPPTRVRSWCSRTCSKAVKTTRKKHSAKRSTRRPSSSHAPSRGDSLS
jgi:hypothetical protein